ncbi:hypothetical protein DSC45_13980 [Streptomyces sp. YIM 130001]|uniref:hypothetical protein n=1 Tax=Streptomyces sp. YIM 130001 TaxID=2259644 RepID=UPI000E6576D7|nr:hypothetical protein [Streptomyces sp. YIM 130001]RII17266.1 hypothetical protein DSC45_13980 [Streptomyces sp. YIM 130001]
MGEKRRLTGLFAGAALVAGALVGTAAPAQAYSPDPTAHNYYRDTGKCPCSGGTLADPFDGTYFKRDAGGTAVKMELLDGSWFVGKVEFHPSSEKLWIYDTKNDGDAFYVHASYTYKGKSHNLGTFSAPGTSAVVDHTVKDFDIPEGAYVDITVYDGKGHSDFIAAARGTGGAVA